MQPHRIECAVILLGCGVYSSLPRRQIEQLMVTVRAVGRYGLVLHAFVDQGDTSLPDALDTCVAAGAQRVIVQPIFIPGDANLQIWLAKVVCRWQAQPHDADLVVVMGQSLGDHAALTSALVQALDDAANGTDIATNPPRNWERDPAGWSMLPEHEYHILTCRGPRCTAHGANACWESFAQRLTDHELRGGNERVLVAQTGCLYPCNRGPILIVYPDGVWYGGITPANVGRIVDEHLAGGRVVEELRIAPGTLAESADDEA